MFPSLTSDAPFESEIMSVISPADPAPTYNVGVVLSYPPSLDCGDVVSQHGVDDPPVEECDGASKSQSPCDRVFWDLHSLLISNLCVDFEVHFLNCVLR